MIKCHNTLQSLTDTETYYDSNHAMFHRSLSLSPCHSFFFTFSVSLMLPSFFGFFANVKFCPCEMWAYLQNTLEKIYFFMRIEDRKANYMVAKKKREKNQTAHNLFSNFIGDDKSGGMSKCEWTKWCASEWVNGELEANVFEHSNCLQIA